MLDDSGSTDDSDMNARVLRECLYLEELVEISFDLAKSESVLLSAICLDTVLDMVFCDRVVHWINACHIKVNGMYMQHYNVRILLPKKCNGKQGIVHLDIGAKMYEKQGVIPNSLYYSSSVGHDWSFPDSEMMDESSEVTKRAKRRNDLVFKLLKTMPNRQTFFRSILRSFPFEDKWACHLALGSGVLTRKMIIAHAKIFSKA